MFSTHEIQFSELKKTPLHWAENELRLSAGLALYFLDFEFLPWTAAVLVAPRNHVFSSAPRSSYAAGELSVDAGPQQVAWTQPFFIDKATPRKFRKELKLHGLTEQEIPYGLLSYDGELLGTPMGFNKKERPLTSLWFRTFLIP